MAAIAVVPKRNRASRSTPVSGEVMLLMPALLLLLAVGNCDAKTAKGAESSVKLLARSDGSEAAVPTLLRGSKHQTSNSSLRRHLLQLPISTDGTCGSTVGKQCTSGNCCSQWNSCGATPTHCGSGCQPAYGICAGTGTPPTGTPPTGTPPTGTPSTGPTVSQPLDKWYYRGCYADDTPGVRILPDSQGYGKDIQTCIMLCRNRRWRFAGLQYGGECWCGANSDQGRLDESSCKMACNANPSQTCGGRNANQVYDIPATQAMSVQVNGWGYRGCFADGPDRDLPFFLGNLGITQCIVQCSSRGYTFAGVQNGNECWCGNQVGRWGQWDQNKCANQCFDDSMYTCGGPWGNQVYSRGTSGITLTVPASWSSSSTSPIFIRTVVSPFAWGSVNGLPEGGVGISLTSYVAGYDGNPGGPWFLQTVNNLYAFRQADTGICLDTYSSTTAGTQLVQWECANPPNNNQVWAVNYVRTSDSAVQWRNPSSGLCLDGDSGAVGTPLRLAVCRGTSDSLLPSQLFVTFNSIAPAASPTGLFFPTSSAVVLPRVNTLSRYDSWRTQLPSSVDLRNSLVAPKDQGRCASCWAFSAVAAIESAYNLAYSSYSSLSEQELIDCGASVPGVCSGGWPAQAFDWVATSPQGLATTQAYGPYTSGGSLVAATCRSQTGGVVRVSRYEQVASYNSLQLRAALTRQPVVAYMTLTMNFRQWNTWNIFTDAEGQCKEQAQLNHVVTIVGYGTEWGQPFWIVRNSNGTSWGSGGYARVLDRGGLGVCGITAAPTLYPVIARTDGTQCRSPHPCGAGTCNPGSGTSYTCSNCPAGYVVATNTDGTQTCALMNVCGSDGVNPCGPGTCINENNGYYHCFCNMGYLPGKKGDGSPTCVVPGTADKISAPTYYTVQPGDNCYIIAYAFGITLQQLIDKNGGLAANPCNNLPISRTLDVSSVGRGNCKVLYSIQRGDSCWGIEQLFNLQGGSLNRTLNPGLVCEPTFINGIPAGIQPGQQVCVASGTPDNTKICNSMRGVTAAEAANKWCPPLYANTGMDTTTFFELNRGINCNNLYAGQQICTNFYVGGPGGCSPAYTWQRGDTCFSVQSKFCGSSGTWAQCFWRYPTCTASMPVGTRVCRRFCRGAEGGQVSNCG